MTHLAIQNVSKQYGASFAVKDFTLEIDKGEFVSFLGPSGCGKTTTLRMVAGFEIPTAGQIILDDVDITEKAPNQRNVGMVFQSYALFPNMTVAQNIGFGLKIRKESQAVVTERVNEMLGLIHLEAHAHKYPFQLSGGQQQRVSLGRALAIRPQVLLLDEPLSALDAKIRVTLRSEIRSIQKKLGITAIFVTHDQEEALSISDRIVVMNEGREEQIGSPFEVYNFPKTAFVAEFVGTLNKADAVIVDPTNHLLAMDGVQFQSAGGMEGKRTGDKVRIAIRPERFSFAAEQRKTNVVQCAIENITFLGSIVRIQISIGQTRFHMDTFNNPFLALPKIGDTAEVTCSQEAASIIGEKD